MNTETGNLLDWKMLLLRASKDCTPNLLAGITHNLTPRNLCGNDTEKRHCRKGFLFSRTLNSQPWVYCGGGKLTDSEIT